jgi:hypothetical protein
LLWQSRPTARTGKFRLLFFMHGMEGPTNQSANSSPVVNYLIVCYERERHGLCLCPGVAGAVGLHDFVGWTRPVTSLESWRPSGHACAPLNQEIFTYMSLGRALSIAPLRTTHMNELGRECDPGASIRYNIYNSPTQKLTNQPMFCDDSLTPNWTLHRYDNDRRDDNYGIASGSLGSGGWPIMLMFFLVTTIIYLITFVSSVGRSLRLPCTYRLVRMVAH